MKPKGTSWKGTKEDEKGNNVKKENFGLPDVQLME